MVITDQEIQFRTPEGAASLKIEHRHFSIDPSLIDPELCQIAALIMHYGTAEAYLRLDAERREAELEHYDADLDLRIRAEETTKLTEKKVEAMVTRDQGRQALLAHLGKSRLDLNIVRWAMKALEAKRDCLVAMTYRENQLIKSERYSERR